jgi:ABC-2 type transport system ATP-binding protein
VRAVDGISFSVNPGEVFGFLGHNGAGKTTTIRMMNGVLAPTSGSLQVLGLEPLSQGSELRRRTGVLTEAPSLDERLSARENLTVFGHLYGVAEDRVPGRVEELLAQFELSDRGDDKVGGYSKGMKQRLALARALIHQPELLFLDEPTAGLDPMAARQVHDLIRRLRQAGRTIFLCTHNLIEAQRLCDRVAVLRHGQLVALGTVAELSARIGGGQELEIEVGEGQQQKGLQVVRRRLGSEQARLDRGFLVIEKAAREQIPAILQDLIAAGVDVFRVSPQDPSLEEIYFGLHQDGGEQ